jgi:hypothetical protein
VSDSATSQIDDYQQIGNSSPVDSYQPGENKQRIDLTEYYQVSEQNNATVMVMGSEQLNLGTFSKQVARHLKLQGVENYDPFPSERNARMGAEGFFSAVYNGFKDFIEAIIKYIRMAIDWVVDMVKGIFGFRKSERITKAIDDALPDLKKEFEDTLISFGFNIAEYNVENFLGKLPAGQDRVAQIHLLKNKLDSDVDQIKKLEAAIPLIQQINGKIKQGTDKVNVAQRRLKKVILDEYNRSRVRYKAGSHVDGASSSEVTQVLIAIQETSLALDTKEVVSLVAKLYKDLYSLDFSNDELANKFDQVQNRLKTEVQASTSVVRGMDVSTTMASIQALNVRYQNLVDTEVDISRIDWKGLGEIIHKSDSEKLSVMATYYQAPAILSAYQELSVDIRNFTQCCYGISKEVLRVERQITSLVEWYGRIHAYYYSGVLGDLDTVEKIVAEARAKGLSPIIEGRVFIKDADAKTFAEKLSANVNFAIKNDVGGVKTSLNNFTKQIGAGRLL